MCTKKNNFIFLIEISSFIKRISLCSSKDDVGSSRRRTFGFKTIHLINDNLCFSPPERVDLKDKFVFPKKSTR